MTDNTDDRLSDTRAEGSLPLCDCRCDAARDAEKEIELLYRQVEVARSILWSEAMIWVFHGSDGWQQSNLEHLRDPIHKYWETYGNVFREVQNG